MCRTIVAGILIGVALAVTPAALQAAEAALPCSQHGPGFARPPGGKACVRIGGRVRGETQVGARRAPADDVAGLRSQGRLDLDARAQTDYGPVRAFVRMKGGSATGSG